MKKLNSLLFVFIALVAFVLNSCGSDNEDNPETDEITIVQNAIKGKFYNVGIEAYKFNDNNVDVWYNIINDGEYYQYANIKYSIYPEKQYIVIKTNTETLLYYKVVNNKVVLYTDVNKTTILSDTKQPTDFVNESKEPTNNNDGEIYLTTLNTIVDFNTWEYQSINSDRLMYIKDLNGKTILTLNWYQYQRIEQIANVGSYRNLVGFYQGKMYIKDLFNNQGTSIMYGDKDDVSVKLYRTEIKGSTTTIVLKIDITNTKANIKGYVEFSYNK
ncbi:MAG: hypothetical protein ACK5KT_15720 [Dysgonomonas sp.]